MSLEIRLMTTFIPPSAFVDQSTGIKSVKRLSWSVSPHPGVQMSTDKILHGVTLHSTGTPSMHMYRKREKPPTTVINTTATTNSQQIIGKRRGHFLIIFVILSQQNCILKQDAVDNSQGYFPDARSYFRPANQNVYLTTHNQWKCYVISLPCSRTLI